MSSSEESEDYESSLNFGMEKIEEESEDERSTDNESYKSKDYEKSKHSNLRIQVENPNSVKRKERDKISEERIKKERMEKLQKKLNKLQQKQEALYIEEEEIKGSLKDIETVDRKER